jgi:two-component system chemotaxis response regulator CheB
VGRSSCSRSGPGGISALREIARALPADLPAALCVVVHVAADSQGILPAILEKSGPLPASHPRDGEDIRPGHIYVAPPDHHLIVELAGRLRLGRGPKENRVRPAVDPLFRSAALAYGPRAAGVVLSGGLVDGTAGLLEIKRAGGLALVQDPGEAESPSMPRSALRHVEVDHCLAVNALGRCITALASAPAPPQSSEIAMPRHLETEVAIATGVDAVAAGVAQLGAPSMLTCPDCHGVLLRIDDDRLVRFRCHTGHAFNGEDLMTAQSDTSEEALWSAVRALREHEFLLRELAKKHEAQGDPQAAAHARARSEHIEGLARAIREAAEELSPLGVPGAGAERRGQAIDGERGSVMLKSG